MGDDLEDDDSTDEDDRLEDSDDLEDENSIDEEDRLEDPEQDEDSSMEDEDKIEDPELDEDPIDDLSNMDRYIKPPAPPGHKGAPAPPGIPGKNIKVHAKKRPRPSNPDKGHAKKRCHFPCPRNRKRVCGSDG